MEKLESVVKSGNGLFSKLGEVKSSDREKSSDI